LVYTNKKELVLVLMTDEIELNRKISKLEIKEYMQTEAE
jgi:hypothetical protein